MVSEVRSSPSSNVGKPISLNRNVLYTLLRKLVSLFAKKVQYPASTLSQIQSKLNSADLQRRNFSYSELLSYVNKRRKDHVLSREILVAQFVEDHPDHRLTTELKGKQAHYRNLRNLIDQTKDGNLWSKLTEDFNKLKWDIIALKDVMASGLQSHPSEVWTKFAVVEYSEAAQAIVSLAKAAARKDGKALEGHIEGIVEKLGIESDMHRKGLEDALNHVL